jgi:hypothetical protein
VHQVNLSQYKDFTIVSLFAMFLMGILFITHTIKFMEYKKTSEVIIDVNTKEVNKVSLITILK